MSYLQDPEYKNALDLYQRAEWEACLKVLEGLEEQFPDEPELTQFVDEVKMRAKFSQEGETSESETEKSSRRTIWSYAIAGVLGLVIVLAAWFFGFRALDDYYTTQRIAVDAANLEQELESQFTQAEGLLQAGRSEEALRILNEIKAEDANYPGVNDLIEAAEADIALSDDYAQAVSTMESGALEDALAQFEAIQAQNPIFRDVTHRINDINELLDFQVQLEEANQAYTDEDWELAIQLYEQLIESHANLIDDSSSIEDNLYESYLEIVMDMLTQETLSIEEIDQAEAYYLRSRALKPQDQELQAQRRTFQRAVYNLLIDKFILLANEYIYSSDDLQDNLVRAHHVLSQALKYDPESREINAALVDLETFQDAVDKFETREYVTILPALEEIYQRDPLYGGGILSFMLYESYTAHGFEVTETGIYEDALGNFQRAELMALRGNPRSVRVYESQLNVALILGKMALFQDACAKYTSIIDEFSIMERAENRDPELFAALTEAFELLEEADFRNAYLKFDEAFSVYNDIYDYHSQLALDGDNIIYLAFEQDATLQLFREVNNIHPEDFYFDNDMEVQIPSFEE